MGSVGGSEFKYKLLFIILLSNCFAIFLQRLTLKLGIVSGKGKMMQVGSQISH
jgi:Mn2+/Fe2+ NRAMP family transporter